MPKYYIESGNLQIIETNSDMIKAVLAVFERILSKGDEDLNLADYVIVSESGFVGKIISADTITKAELKAIEDRTFYLRNIKKPIVVDRAFDSIYMIDTNMILKLGGYVVSSLEEDDDYEDGIS